MKAKVLDRPMFKKKGPPVSPDEADNVGIMQGFMDQIDGMDDMEEEGDEDEMEMGKMMDRRPDSPEILMNNLRGDMRSVDARVEELADLVGYRAASDTPTEVLALLQPVLAQQTAMAQPPAPMAGPTPPGAMGAPAGGIADLAAMAQGPQTTPPGPMSEAPVPMPEAPPPGGIGSLPAAAEQQAPMAMANGGYVQNFQQGSDEDGVTPVEEQPSYINYSKDMIQQARDYLAKQAATQQIKVPDLATEATRRAKDYAKIIGGEDNRQMTQAQMLFDIASGALNVASGVDAEGRPVRGLSPVGRFAAGMKNVPAMIGARAGELQKQERALKVAGIESAERRIQSVIDYNLKLIESNRKIFTDVLKNSGMGSLFGKGDWEWRIINTPGMLSDWAAGKTDEGQTQLVESAITKLKEPRVETRVDPVTKQPYTVNINPIIPKFVQQAIDAHGTLFKDQRGVTTAPVTTAPVSRGDGGGQASAPVKEAEAFFAGATYVAKVGKNKVPYFYRTPTPNEPTFYSLAGKGTGIVNITGGFIKEIPVIGGLFNTDEQLYAKTFLEQSTQRIVDSLRQNDRFTNAEAESIKNNLKTAPQLIDNENAYKIRLRALDDLLVNIGREAYKLAYDTPKLKPEDIAANRLKIEEVQRVRKLIGLPPPDAKVLQSKAQWDSSPKGSVWIVEGELRVKP